MIILLYTILIVTAALIMVYDYKIQKIPIWLLIINYVSICLISNKWLFIGIIFIFVAKKYDKPIDPLYVALVCYFIFMNQSIIQILFILILIFHIAISKKCKISFMLPLEIVIVCELLLTGLVNF